jgi:hypothetical protein
VVTSLTPATPSDMRARIRRFGWIEPWTGEQPGNSKCRAALKSENFVNAVGLLHLKGTLACLL